MVLRRCLTNTRLFVKFLADYQRTAYSAAKLADLGQSQVFLCPAVPVMATIPLLGVIYMVELMLRIIHWRSRSQQEEESLCAGVRNDFLHQELWMKIRSAQVASKRYHGNFPGNPVVKTPYFRCRGHRFNP